MNSTDLKSFRKMVRLSQQQLATLLGYSRRNYQKMENGEYKIRNSVKLACAAHALGIEHYDGPTAKRDYQRRKKAIE